MSNKQASKSGIPFVTFLLVTTVLVGIWFLTKSNKVTEEIDQTVNQSVNQAQVINSNSNVQKTGDTIVGKDENLIVFQNPEYKFSYNLLANEAVKEEKSATIYTVYFNSDKLSILDEGMETAVRGAIATQSAKEVSIDGIMGEEIVANSNKDGSQTNLILIKKDGKLFHFQGTAEFLTKIKTEFFFDS
ncbi:MAG: hypothetical protein WC693_04900 [Patescibacteria group bacterium]|jgi:hypothetical protein